MEALPKIEGEIMECAFYDLPEDTAITRVGWGEVRDAIEQARAEGAREALAGVEVRLHPPVTAMKSLCEWAIYKAQPHSAVESDCEAITAWLWACSRETIGGNNG